MGCLGWEYALDFECVEEIPLAQGRGGRLVGTESARRTVRRACVRLLVIEQCILNLHCGMNGLKITGDRSFPSAQPSSNTTTTLPSAHAFRELAVLSGFGRRGAPVENSICAAGAICIGSGGAALNLRQDSEAQRGY